MSLTFTSATNSDSESDPLPTAKRSRWKIIRRLLGIIALAFIAVTGTFIWRAAGQLAKPPRLAKTPAAIDILNAPEKQGVQIRSGLALNQKVPYLIVEPIAGLQPGERGKLLRQQLQQDGFSLPPFGTIRGTVVLLHGRMSRKENFLAVAVRFCAGGYRCIIPDLPAHGDSPLSNVHFGSTDFEATLPEKLHHELLAKGEIGNEPVSLWGMSMGGAFATSAASRNPDYWKSLTVIASFDHLDQVVAEKARGYAGPLAHLLAEAVRHTTIFRGGCDPAKSQPATWASKVTTPVLVIHGSDDNLIPFESGNRLYNAFASTSKAWMIVEGAAHSNVLITPEPTYRTMAQWLASPTTLPETLPTAESNAALNSALFLDVD